MENLSFQDRYYVLNDIPALLDMLKNANNIKKISSPCLFPIILNNSPHYQYKQSDSVNNISSQLAQSSFNIIHQPPEMVTLYGTKNIYHSINKNEDQYTKYFTSPKYLFRDEGMNFILTQYIDLKFPNHNIIYMDNANITFETFFQSPKYLRQMININVITNKCILNSLGLGSRRETYHYHLYDMPKKKTQHLIKAIKQNCEVILYDNEVFAGTFSYQFMEGEQSFFEVNNFSVYLYFFQFSAKDYQTIETIYEILKKVIYNKGDDEQQWNLFQIAFLPPEMGNINMLISFQEQKKGLDDKLTNVDIVNDIFERNAQNFDVFDDGQKYSYRLTFCVTHFQLSLTSGQLEIPQGVYCQLTNRHVRNLLHTISSKQFNKKNDKFLWLTIDAIQQKQRIPLQIEQLNIKNIILSLNLINYYMALENNFVQIDPISLENNYVHNTDAQFFIIQQKPHHYFKLDSDQLNTYLEKYKQAIEDQQEFHLPVTTQIILCDQTFYVILNDKIRITDYYINTNIDESQMQMLNHQKGVQDTQQKYYQRLVYQVSPSTFSIPYTQQGQFTHSVLLYDVDDVINYSQQNRYTTQNLVLKYIQNQIHFIKNKISSQLHPNLLHHLDSAQSIIQLLQMAIPDVIQTIKNIPLLEFKQSQLYCVQIMDIESQNLPAEFTFMPYRYFWPFFINQDDDFDKQFTNTIKAHQIHQCSNFFIKQKYISCYRVRNNINILILGGIDSRIKILNQAFQKIINPAADTNKNILFDDMFAMSLHLINADPQYNNMKIDGYLTQDICKGKQEYNPIELNLFYSHDDITKISSFFVDILSKHITHFSNHYDEQIFGQYISINYDKEFFKHILTNISSSIINQIDHLFFAKLMKSINQSNIYDDFKVGESKSNKYYHKFNNCLDN